MLHRSRPFLLAYRFLPHRLLNGAAAWLVRRERPRSLVRAAIDAWVRRERIDLADFAPAPYRTVEEFFLRRLRPGARPLGDGFVSPVDARIVEAGTIEGGAELRVKGRRVSVERLVNGGRHALPLDDYRGGRYAILFLSPRGYHRIHMPSDGVVESCRHLPGRFFPQNEDALRHLDGVHLRNERAVLACRGGDGPFLLVLVGASLVGSIELADLARADWARREPVTVARLRRKGEEIGHFTFGSTVVVLLPRSPRLQPARAAGDDVKMGETLYRAA